ncbi:MAG: hypothetical protein RBT65_17515 [Methanolobus sp.]|nr:hypothetical protein [Methanolobus sp.]
MISKELAQFIEIHKETNPLEIILSRAKYPNIDVNLAATIISARKKLISKMPEWASRKDLMFPSTVPAEQCSSSLTAKYKQKYSTDGIVLDITGGLGIDSFYFSKNNEKVYYFERNKTLYEAVKYNFKCLDINNVSFSNIELTAQNIENTLLELSINNHDKNKIVIYLDPSRRKKDGSRAVAMAEYEPNITSIKNALFKFSDRIIIKLSPMEDIKAAASECGNVSLAQIISVDNECKELLLHLDKNHIANNATMTINAVSLKKNEANSLFTFTYDQEKDASCYYCENELDKYIYEPDVSVLKAGAFKLVAQRFNLKKIANNTHLYSASFANSSFPGKVFEIKEVAEYSKNAIRNLSKSYPKANIVTRNFPLGANALRKVLKIGDGGTVTIFGCTLNSGVKKLVISQKIN